jgi:hypothetical protein
MITLICVASVASLALGFAVGKLHERVAWNELIKRGRLPAPHTRWRRDDAAPLGGQAGKS